MLGQVLGPLPTSTPCDIPLCSADIVGFGEVGKGKGLAQKQLCKNLSIPPPLPALSWLLDVFCPLVAKHQNYMASPKGAQREPNKRVPALRKGYGVSAHPT